jgi:tetratricopeptide (TPR) repeat protein
MFAACALVLVTTGSSFSDEYIDKVRQQRAAVRAEAYISETKAALARGDYLKAIRVATAAIQNGAGIEAYRLRAQAHYHKKAYADATTDLTRVVSGGSTDPADRVFRGDVFNIRREYQKALDDYGVVIQNDPLFLESYKGRSTIYIALERYDLAMRDLQVVLRSEPSDPEALYNMGVACVLADLPSTARSYLESALKVETSDGWRRRVETLLAKLPENSMFEQKVGGLAGYLETSSQAGGGQKQPGSKTAPHASGAPDPPHVSARESGAVDNFPLKKDLLASRPENSHLKGSLAGSHMGFQWTFKFDSKGRNVSGVLHIRGPAGIEETHLCSGTVDRGFVEMSDRTGYRFHGRITENLRLLGTLSTNRGQSFSVDVPLRE